MSKRSRRAGLRLVVALGVVMAVAAGLGVRTCVAPTDVSGTLDLPDGIVALKASHELAYPAHALLGRLLNDLGCHPTAAGLQWLKAAAHARTPGDVGAAAAGVLTAEQRADDVALSRETVCSYLWAGFASASQREAVSQAGLGCAGRP